MLRRPRELRFTSCLLTLVGSLSSVACGSGAEGDIHLEPGDGSGGEGMAGDTGAGGSNTGGAGASGGGDTGGASSGGGNTGGIGGTGGGESCPLDTWDDDADPSTVCVAKADCGNGQYVIAYGGTTEDRSCNGCPSGHFSVGPNAQECTLWQTCAAGSYVANTPSNEVDRVCVDCEDGYYTSGDDQSECVLIGTCAPGTVQTAPGSDTSPPVCAPCAEGTYCAGDTAPQLDCAFGTWDHDADPATECAQKTECIDGEYVGDEGDATSDHVCIDCEDGSYSAGPNADACAAWTQCDPGSAVTNTPSATEDSVCEACAVGTYCAGGLAAAVDCAAETWDDDADAATACVAKSDCAPGTHVDVEGDATVNRICDDCEGGFSPLPNQLACTPWTVCAVELTPGTATTDSVCKPEEWLKQFGNAGDDGIQTVHVDGNGDLLVMGSYGAGTALPGEMSSGGADVYIRKYDDLGSVIWTTQFGTTSADYSGAGTIDASGNSYFVGQTQGTFPGETSAGGMDCFVSKADAAGNLLWTKQFGTTSTDQVLAVATDVAGNVYVAGYTGGVFSGQSSLGGQDAFLGKYDANGNALWMKHVGTAGLDNVAGLHAEASGNVYLAGYTSGAFAGETNAGGFWDGFVRKVDGSGDAIWTKHVGTSGGDNAFGVTTDKDGNVYVAGYVGAALPGQVSAGSEDAYFRKLDSAGNVLLTRQFGASSYDYARSVAVDASGNVYLAGAVTGALPGQMGAGSYDAFVRKYDSSGNVALTRQLGTSASDNAYSVAVDSLGSIYAVGYTAGSLPGYSNAGNSDAFLVKIVP